MRILVAPDSFKGSLTALEASHIMEKAIKDVNSEVEVLLRPMADGGEGTMDSLLLSMNGEKIPITCTGALGERINTSYVIIKHTTAVIEFASIAGLVQINEEQRHPDYTTSFGIGEAIINALDKGCDRIIIGLGGSATNDGGLGMLQALGMIAWDESNEVLDGYGKDMKKVKKVSFLDIDPRLNKVKIQVACDVKNPLCGKNGSTYVYGQQKGIKKYQMEDYDSGLKRYSEIIEKNLHKNIKCAEGAGAAGGVGFALMAIGAENISGAELVANITGIESAIKEVDLVITGEGKSDNQTLFGKAPGHVAEISKRHNIPVVLISGCVSRNDTKLEEIFSALFPIANEPMRVEDSMNKAEELLYGQTRQIFRLIDVTRNI